MKFSFLIPEHLREEIEGDLEQRFQKDIRKHGIRRAKRNLFWNQIRFLRPGIIFRKQPFKKHYPPFMFKNYVAIAVRNMMAHKTNSAINILSLIVGITSALIMISVIRYELSFDSFHTNADKTYRIYRSNDRFDDLGGVGVPGPLTDAFRQEISGIERITGVQYYGGAQVDVEINGDVRRFKETRGTVFADYEFFNVFDFDQTGFKWISGDPEQALKEPYTIVITEAIAKKYFGSADPMGKTIKLEAQLDVKVTGVITDLPPNSDFPFTLLISYPTLYELEPGRMKDDWLSINADQQAFVTLPANTSIEEVVQQFYKVHSSHVDKESAERIRYVLQPLSDVHKNGNLGNFNRRTADKTALLIMGITGLLLLAVGCINYINIATAQSTLRGKEIGVRKALGSQRKQLILQFISETFVLVLAGCVVSIFLADMILANLTTLTNIVMMQHLFADPLILVSLAVLVIIVTAIAGFYPAIVVSGYGVITALKGLTNNRVSSSYLRKTLVVVQFAVTQVFLIGAFIVINQLQYSRTMDLGFNKDLILNIPIPENSRKENDLRNRVLSDPLLSNVTLSSSYPSGDRRNRWFMGITKPGEQDIVTEYQSVDTAFFNVYDIPFVAGRDFLESDSLTSAILNETVCNALGYDSPDDAIGNILDIDGKKHEVVGVVKDFHNTSVREKIGNVVFIYKPSFLVTSSVKLKDPGALQESILALEKIWALVYPQQVFEYRFFDENIEGFYREEKKLSTLLQTFSGVFLLIACLGLYGLLSFVINRRMKEVAVRKVFGAGIANIITLISKDYVVLILVSFVIAAPLSYYFMDQWLQGFEYHTPITWWILVTPGMVALAIAMITLSSKLFKAASTNPAETLKYE